VPVATRSLATRPPSLLTVDASPAEAHVLRIAARTAEDAGDFPGALRLVSGLPDGRATRHWYRQLMAAAALAPEDLAALACWILHPAARWAHERPAGLIFEQHAALMLKTMGVGAEHRERRAPAVAYSDPVVVDAGLFDTGLFSDYLLGLADSPLFARLPELNRWSAQESLVWQVLKVAAGEIVMRDLWTEREVCALDGASAEALAPGSLVYGRLLPVAGDPGLTFALQPAKIDQRCATRLLRARRQGSGPEERLRAVGHSRRRAIQAGELRL
jgi:hypothetical protein